MRQFYVILMMILIIIFDRLVVNGNKLLKCSL